MGDESGDGSGIMCGGWSLDVRVRVSVVEQCEWTLSACRTVVGLR